MWDAYLKQPSCLTPGPNKGLVRFCLVGPPGQADTIAASPVAADDNTQHADIVSSGGVPLCVASNFSFAEKEKS